MRVKEENDQLFQNLMKLNSIFIWKGHLLELTGESIHVTNELALKELKENTTSDFHNFIHLTSTK
jgi:hypothetical protein